MLQAHCGLLEDLDGFVTPPKSPNFPLSTDRREGVIGASPILGFPFWWENLPLPSAHG